MSEPPKFRAINPILGSSPQMGPIPADLVLPWLTISFVLLIMCRSVFHLSWAWTGMFIVWGDATWWILNGSNPYRFLSKFIGVPKWTRHYIHYKPLHSKR